MSRETVYGNPNPEAPPELSQFAFIIGEWSCDVRVKRDDGTWQAYQATWVGRYILDGFVIADVYRMANQAGELVVHGMNFRSYTGKEDLDNEMARRNTLILGGTWSRRTRRRSRHFRNNYFQPHRQVCS